MKVLLRVTAWTSSHSSMFLTLGIFTTEGKKIIINYNNNKLTATSA